MWLLAAELFSCYVLFVVLLLCLLNPVLHCNHIVGEGRASYFAFLWFLICELSLLVSLLYLLVAVVEYVL